MLHHQKSSSISVTTKWDGAPAIVCGVDPQTNLFLLERNQFLQKQNLRYAIMRKILIFGILDN